MILATGYAELPPQSNPELPKLGKPFLQYDLAQAMDTAMREHSAGCVLKFRAQLVTPQQLKLNANGPSKGHQRLGSCVGVLPLLI